MTVELLAIGETMAVVAPIDGSRLAEAAEFRLDAGGAESNVAAHVAALGHRAAWYSRLGTDALGDRILRQLAQRGVDVSGVERDPIHPTGLYLKDPGHAVRYYRAGSAAAQLGPEDAQRLPLQGLRLLHLSGITAAISPSAAAFLDRVIERARVAGVLLSFDVNHRAALWSASIAAERLEELARRADVVFVGRDEAEGLWHTSSAESVRARFPEVPQLVVKDGAFGATAFTPDGTVFEPSPRIHVVDAVGAGDAFAGGYLAALLDGATVADRLRLGHARAALTLQSTSDSVLESATSERTAHDAG